jgi:hypothetical protein
VGTFVADCWLSARILAQGQSREMLRLLGRERSGQGFFFPILNHLPILAIMRLIQQVYADAMHALGIPWGSKTRSWVVVVMRLRCIR